MAFLCFHKLYVTLDIKAKKLSINGLKNFIKGLELDYTAVLNSLLYQESNCLIETYKKRDIFKKLKRYYLTTHFDFAINQ